MTISKYASENPHDEIAFYLGLDFDPVKRTPIKKWERLELKAQECNHIFTNPRLNLRSNLIRLSARAHRAFHGSIEIERVLCLCAKARKAERTGDPREFNIDELNLCRGRRGGVIGFLETATIEGWAEQYRSEALHRLQTSGEVR